MLYVVLIPAWLWVGALVAAWGGVAVLTFSRPPPRTRTLAGLVAVMAVQAIAASSTAIVTSRNPLNDYACLMGYVGMWVALAVFLGQAIVLSVFLVTIRRRKQTNGARLGGAWLSIWLIFNVVALLAHMRSTALCTV